MIALFGGTFDPVHVGHVAAAKAALELLRVSEVRLVVAASPYHKTAQGQAVSDSEHRLAMVQSACATAPGLVADASELGRAEPSYTFDLLQRRRAGAPRERRVWVIGSDAFADIGSWYRWQEVFALTNFLVLARKGARQRPPEPADRWVRARETGRIDGRKHGQVRFADVDLPEVSSSEIRRQIAAGGVCEHLLPPGVFTYIRRHHLYSGP